MMRHSQRWDTRLGRWVRGYGAPRLARDVGLALYGVPLSSGAVYSWVAGRRLPRPECAVALSQLSGGALSLADVYGHRGEVKGNA